MGEIRNDLNRVGLFSELGYVSVGDPYNKKTNGNFNESAHKGKQMHPGGIKSKSALQAGYFDKSFGRIMTGEGYSDPVKRRRQDRLEKRKLNIANAFMPSHTGKEPSGQGSHYGTFSGPVATFSPVETPKKPYVSPGRNFTTNPSKKGTGYGYVHILIGKPQQHDSGPYDEGKEVAKRAHAKSKELMKGTAFKLNLHPNEYFDGNPYKTDKPMPPFKETKKEQQPTKPFIPSSFGKEIGGSKAGCFTHYPSHSEDLYITKKSSLEDNKQKNIFLPPQGPKSLRVHSIMAHNVERRINCQNFKEFSLSSVSV